MKKDIVEEGRLLGDVLIEAPLGAYPGAAEVVRRLCDALEDARRGPILMLLWCPECGERHLDEGEFATKPHHTHACQHCGMVWRPAIVFTVGVRFLPGFRNKKT